MPDHGSPGGAHDLTRILNDVSAGEPGAEHELYELVYDELRAVARGQMRWVPPNATIQATAVVHEVWIRLHDREETWEGRRHFFHAAARAMHDILVEQARRRAAQKRGGHLERSDLEDVEMSTDLDSADLLALSEALDALRAEDPRSAELVMLRFFVGLSVAEAARDLDISPATAGRDWEYARAFLHRQVHDDQTN